MTPTQRTIERLEHDLFLVQLVADVPKAKQIEARLAELYQQHAAEQVASLPPGGDWLVAKELLPKPVPEWRLTPTGIDETFDQAEQRANEQRN